MQDFIGCDIGYDHYRAKAQSKVVYPSFDPFARVRKALDLVNDPEKPVHDLGKRFFTEVLNKKIKPDRDWTKRAEAARHLLSGSLPFAQAVKFLARWLLHPDAQKRPTLEKVREILEKHLPNPFPPSLSAVKFNDLDEGTQKFFKLDTLEKVVEFLNKNQNFRPDPYVFARGKDTNRNDKIYSLIDAEKKPYFIFLHRKSQKSDSGSFKVGRVCHMIQKRGDTWEANRCYALTSRYGENEVSKKTKKTPETPNTQSQEYYKEFYPKEMALYQRAQGKNVFITHRVSFFFTDKAKQHKRLGIYDRAVTTLYQSILDKRCTLQRQLNLVRRVQELHALGLVHGDIKPENILIGENDKVYLGDIDSILEEEAVRDFKGKGFSTEHYLAENFDKINRFERDRIALIRTLKHCHKANRAISEDTTFDQLIAHLELLDSKKKRSSSKSAADSIVPQMQELHISDEASSKKPKTKVCLIQ